MTLLELLIIFAIIIGFSLYMKIRNDIVEGMENKKLEDWIEGNL